MRTRPLAVITFVLALGMWACRADPQAEKKKFLESGDAYMAKKSYAEAIIQYRNAVAKDNRSGEAHAKLARALELSGNLRNALTEYVRAADILPGDPEIQLRAGRLLVGIRRFEEARVRATGVLEKDPKNINALLILGNALAGLNDLEGAVTQLQSAIDSQPQVTFSYTNLGTLQLRQGNAAAAEDTFKRATTADPKSINARLNLANFYWSSRRTKEAEQELKAALAIEPKSLDVNRMLAAFYLSGKNLREGEKYLKAFADLSPDYIPKVALADFYLGDNRTKDALAILEPLTKNNDSFPMAKLRLATIDFQAGRRPEAYAGLEEILKRSSKDVEALRSKARFLLLDRRYNDAIKVADDLVAANAGDAPGYFLRASALAAIGSREDAITAYRKVLELAPSAVPAQTELARLYIGQGENKAALELLSPIVKAQPAAGELRLLMAQALLGSGNVAGAEAELLPLAKSNPTSAAVQMSLGRLYGTKNDRAKARQAFERALQLQPNSLDATTGILSLDMVEKNAAHARKTIDAMLATYPNDGAFLAIAGNTLLSFGDTRRSEELFKKAIAIEPNNMQAYTRLALIYVTEKRLDEARGQFEEMVQRVPDMTAGGRTMIGVLLEMQNKPDDARKQYEQALAANPKAAVAANNLAWQYAETGSNLDVALKLAQTAKAVLTDSATVSDTLGWIYYQRGLTESAISAFRDGAKQDPANAMIQYHLGLAHLKKGETAQAEQALRRALTLNPSFKKAADAKQVLGTMKG